MSLDDGRSGHNRSFIFLSCLVLLCVLAEYFTCGWLPTSDISSAGYDTFSTKNARNHLIDLSNMGPRLAGTHVNEVQTVEMIKRKLNKYITTSMDIDVQHPSSNFHLKFLGGFTNVYKNVTNVAVKFSWPRDTLVNEEDQAILVNAHFDSVPGSPGASDDGVGVACMLEIARILAKGPALKHSVILLFNGAEENNHQAAHGFISQHPWAKSVKYLINLEAIGSGGREIVFQCNSAWMAHFYGRHVPYPRAQVIAHELFKYVLSNAASTDWSTIITYGSPGMAAIDTAYIENGYVYHTSHDTHDVIPDGSLLHTGNNVLFLIRALSENEHKPPSDDADQPMVFFDLLGIAFISYSCMSVHIVHSLMALCGILLLLIIWHVYLPTSMSTSTSRRHHKEAAVVKWGSVIGEEIFCMFFPVLVTALVGCVYMLLCPMRWYNGGVSVALLLFVPSAAVATLWARGAVTGRSHSSSEISVMAAVGMWLCLFLPCLAFGIYSAYMFGLWIVSLAVAYMMSKWFNTRSRNDTLSASVAFVMQFLTKLGVDVKHAPILHYLRQHMYELCCCPVLCLWINLLHTVLKILVPLLGKTGTVTPADPVLGALIGLLVSLPAGGLLAYVIRKPMDGTVVRRMCGVVLCIFLVSSVCMSSYSSERPKRLWIQHVWRDITLSDGSVHNDHGLWVNAFDSRGLSPFRSFFSEANTQDAVVEMQGNVLDGRFRDQTVCNYENGECYFSFPWYFPVADILRESVYVPTTHPPLISKTQKMRLNTVSTSISLPTYTLSRLGLSKNTDLRIVTISLTGPSHMAIVIDDKHRGTRIVQWDLSDDTLSSTNASAVLRHMAPPPEPRFEGVHFITVGFGMCTSPVGNLCSKTIRVLVKGAQHIHVAAYGHYIDVPDTDITRFVKSLPAWSKGAEWTNFPSLMTSKYV